MTVFHAYDIRGLYPSQINPDFAYKLGLVFPSVIKTKKIVVGFDTRIGNSELHKSLVEGLLSHNIQVISIGMCTTPQLYFSVQNLKAGAGIMITASHNPKEYNGFKFVGKNAEPIGIENGISEIEKKMQKIQAIPFHQIGKIEEHSTAQSYISFLQEFCTYEQPLSIIIDCSNGVAGLIAPYVLENTEHQIKFLNEKPDGLFPSQHPDPTKEGVLNELANIVLQKKADVGFAFDGDGDRLVCIDEKGQKICADMLFALLIDKMGAKKKTIISDIRASKILDDLAKKLDMNLIRSKVGRTYIAQQMRKHNAILGCELSAHYYFKTFNGLDSGILAMLYVIQILSDTQTPLSELIAEYKTYVSMPEQNIKVSNPKLLFESIVRSYPDRRALSEDGITMLGGPSWFTVRSSNTEPLVRVTIEAEDQETLEREWKKLETIILQFKVA